jgi:hypothetical protein
LAEAWSYDNSARTWRFSLRDTAPGSGVPPLGAAQVLTAWRHHPERLKAVGIDSVVTTDARTLVIGVRDAPAEAGKLFAEPALAVIPDSGPTQPSGSSIRIQGVGSTTLEFVTAPGDVRDLLDSGVDLLVTRDLGLVEYAAGHRDLRIFPLPWSRTYVLVQPSTADPLRVALNADSVRESLARDAVKADARPASGRETAACRSRAPVPAALPAPRIVYLAADSVARGLAERIVALDSQDADLRAVGLTDSLLDETLRTGSEGGYIVALSSAAENICSSGIPLPAGASIHPLIETRAHAIVRRGSPELTVDWDGIPRLASPERGKGR